MAEAFAVVGIVASIVQLVDVSAKVLSRLNEFHSQTEEIPKCFRHIKVELPLLLDTLKEIEGQISAGNIASHVQKSLEPVVKACHVQLVSLEEIVNKYTPATGDSGTQRFKKALSSFTQETKVESIQSELLSYGHLLTFYYSVATFKPRSSDGDLALSIRKWLSPPDPTSNYQKGLKLRLEDTGDWLIRGDGYCQWKTNPASILWLHGKAGCGKTILSATIINDLTKFTADDPGKALAFYYFDFNDSQKQIPTLMLKSVVVQLLASCLIIPDAVQTLYATCNSGTRQPYIEELMHILQKIASEIPQCYVVLDALDESQEREHLMEIITAMGSWQIRGLHILITSRKEPDIEAPLEDAVHEVCAIPLETNLVDEDIQKYVRQRLAEDRDLKKWHKDPEMQGLIESTLKEKSDGMFRWAVCQLDSLRKCLNRKMLRKALAELPRTLDETYIRILCSIDEEYQDHALKILQWLAFSRKPLQLPVVAMVIALDPDSEPAYDEDLLLPDPMDIFRICPSLLQYQPIKQEGMIEWGKVTLAHYSVKEFLVSQRILESEASKFGISSEASHRFIARSCLRFLLQIAPQFKEFTPDHPFNALAVYAGSQWIGHAKMVDQESMMELMMALYSQNGRAYQGWNRLWYQDAGMMRGQLRKQPSPPPLYAAAWAGLYSVVERLILSGHRDAFIRRTNYRTALIAAARGEDERIIKLLLESGSDIHATGEHGTALIVAAHRGATQIVQLLLDRGADINAIGHGGCNALGEAMRGGHWDLVPVLLSHGADVDTGTLANISPREGCLPMVQLLIDMGADFNSVCYRARSHRTAAGSALTCNDEGLVELLLNRGADFHAPVEFQGNGLVAALAARSSDRILNLLLDDGVDINGMGTVTPVIQCCQMGNEDILALLLSRGADINLAVNRRNRTGRAFGHPLAAAFARNGVPRNERLVRLLLSRGADPNEPAELGQFGVGCSVLGLPCRRGETTFIQQLLEHGAYVNLRGSAFDTPLTQLASRGDLEGVKLLLSLGADAVEENGSKGSALAAAAGEGHEQIVQFLLDRGCNVNAAGLEGSALMQAIDQGAGELVRILLDHGADINLRAGDDGGPLERATRSPFSDLEFIRFLIDRGAEVNEPGRDVSLSLIHAAERGEIEVVKLLLENGAHINGADDDQRTPLSAAAASGDEKLVELLLRHGAEIHSQGDFKGIALSTACADSPMEVVRLLLDHGADINAPSGQNGPALIVAADDSYGEAFDLLIERGADVNVVGGRSGTALSAASSRGDERMINILLSKGALVNIEAGKMGTAVIAASWGGHEWLVKRLIDEGADIQKETGEYGTALTAAAYSGQERIVDLLLKNGAHINTVAGDYGTALTAAAFQGRIRVFKKLLSHGADTRALGGIFGTALVTACLRRQDRIIQLLLDHGADVNAHGDSKHGSPITAASSQGFQRIVELLLRHGANINEQGGNLGNALAAACTHGYERLAELLIQSGAEVNQIGGEHGTALIAATGAGFERVTRLLLNNGGQVDTVVERSVGTALQAACTGGFRRVARLLLDHGADPNILAGDTGSALAEASYNGWDLVVELLIERGVDVKAKLKGRYGTALEAARDGRRYRVVELLLKHGAE